MKINIIQTSGQTYNKFFLLSNFIADALENNSKIVVLSIDNALKDYPELIKSNTIKFPFYRNSIIKLLGFKFYSKLVRITVDNKVSYLLFKFFSNFFSNVSFIEKYTGKSKYRPKYFNQIKALFTPSSEVIDKCNCFIDLSKGDAEILIGVHIRYGDYKNFKGGKYYYSLSEYKSKMIETKKAFNNKKIVFIIVSNEMIDLDFFKEELTIYRMGDATSTTDVYCLGLCDYIMGPPSTFSGWAAYMNNKPIYFIEDKNEIVQFNSFKRISEIWQ